MLYAELFPRFLFPALLVLLLEIAPAADPLSPVALTMRFAQPLLLWSLLLVPLVVLALVVAFTRRRRLLERLGGRVLVERMAASVSVPRKVLRAGLLVLALGAVAAGGWPGPRWAGGPSWNGSAGWTWWWRWTSRGRCWPGTCTPRASNGPSGSWNG